jgi:hypothetical protein
MTEKRLLLNGIFWILSTGALWRDLSETLVWIFCAGT